jgi:hypothetical protein
MRFTTVFWDSCVNPVMGASAAFYGRAQPKTIQGDKHFLCSILPLFFRANNTPSTIHIRHLASRIVN